MFRFLALLVLAFAGPWCRAQSLVGHDLEVLLSPERGSLAVRDTLTLPEGTDDWTFLLHRDLHPRVAEGDAELTRVGRRDHLAIHRLGLNSPGPVTLRYAGSIQGQLETLREGMGRSRQFSRGMIGAEGVVLDGYSGWYPRNPDSLQHFSLKVQLPPGWIAVSQGQGPDLSETADGVSATWRENLPQDDIHLMAGPFSRYGKSTPHGEAQVYLRSPNEALAERYLKATGHYLRLYSELIGPYPYAKFALVENFWETGYGMPSFTLLGPRVIRLPFILHTSYPHEILHNWWGNGVFVDYEHGNWSEGLTAYLADHLIKEQRGKGAEYRRDSLKSYADYVRDGEDFPVREFRARHGSASQAIGYGKTLMVLHMLRRDLGDEVFLEGLRRFYRDNLFRTAGFDELRGAFEEASGRDLSRFFEHWTLRTGAPDIALADVDLQQTKGGYRLAGRILQQQETEPFPLNVPLVLHLENGDLMERRIPLNGREAELALELTARPIRLSVDPRFDLFRQLVPGETPVTLSALFGAERGLILLPSATGGELAAGYHALAQAWVRGSAGWKVLDDDAIEALPEDIPVWLLGWENRFTDTLAAGRADLLDVKSRSLVIAGESLSDGASGITLVDEQQGRPVGLVAASQPAALPGLARKLPHYGKYSYLSFAGDKPTNRVKGQWPASVSRLQVWFTENRPPLSLPPTPPLSAAAASDSGKSLD
jgi:hypothetical protein